MEKRAKRKLTRTEWVVALSLLCLLLFIVVLLVDPAGKAEEPSYAGQPLTHWIWASRLPGPEGDHARRLVRRAIPRLIGWLCLDEPGYIAPAYMRFCNNLLEKQHLIRFRFEPHPPANRTTMACELLSQLGPGREQAIPRLIALLGEENEAVAEMACSLLQGMAPESVPALTQALSTGNEPERALAATALGEIGRNPQSVVPALQQALKGKSLRVRFEAACALVPFGRQGEELIPLLIEGIKGGDHHMLQEGFRFLMQLCDSNRLSSELTKLLATATDVTLRRAATMTLKSIQAGDSAGAGAVGLPGPDSPEVVRARLAYGAQLDVFRREFGGSRDLPDVPFFLFGMGHRTKMVYRAGRLLDVQSGRVLREWKVRSQAILPSEYRVVLETVEGKTVTLFEDAQGVWEAQGRNWLRLPGTRNPVNLPDFARRRYARILRVLHQELLFNVTEAGPVPNLFVYAKPWYRDGAMVALALRETGNLDLLRDWLLGLCEPYDRNNAGETEADNLGQALFLVSLAWDKTHPLVSRVLAEARRFEAASPQGTYLKGRSDFAEHAAYQTKWFKYGLAALGLPDHYVIPSVPDSYSALFWMGYPGNYAGGKDADDRVAYPYLGWACDHYHAVKKSPISNRDYPLTWEQNASQAHYEGMNVIAPVYAQQRLAAPHTWHAAEVFLYVLNAAQQP